MSDSLHTGYRWSNITPEDHSGILYIVTFLGFIYTSFAFFTRVVIKWRILGLDDGAMLIAQIANAIQFALLLSSLSNGLVKSFSTITNEQYSRMASTYSGGQVAIYISLGVSKIATILLVRRLFIRDMKKAWTTCNAVLCVMFAWTIASAVLVSAGCSAESLSPKTSAQICSGIETRYMIVVVTDAITDLVLAVVPAYLCRHLQMNFLFKLQVLGIFALRLPLLALASLFLKYWKTSLNGDNIGVARTTALVFQQSQLCVSLIAGTIPCLKSFIQSFDTGSGVKAGFGQSTNSSGYGRRSNVQYSSNGRTNNGDSYQMSPLDRSVNSKAKPQIEVDNGGTARVNRKSFTMKLCSATEESSVAMERCSTQDSDRQSQLSTQELVIRKDVRWEVRREAARRNSDINVPGLLRLPK